MRSDMHKVVVERPRGGSWIPTKLMRKGRDKERARARPELAPSKESMSWRRFGRSRHLSDYLAPLERYLAGQIGRPWDKIYSEICRAIPKDGNIRQHIHGHVFDIVALEVKIIDGWPHRSWRGGRYSPLDGRKWRRLYVHPKTKLLRSVPLRSRRRRREDARADRIVIGRFEQLHCIDGVWYALTLAHEDTVEVDVHFHLPPRESGEQRARAYGTRDLAAVSKRQANKKNLRELRERKLIG